MSKMPVDIIIPEPDFRENFWYYSVGSVAIVFQHPFRPFV